MINECCRAAGWKLKCASCGMKHNIWYIRWAVTLAAILNVTQCGRYFYVSRLPYRLLLHNIAIRLS